MNDPPFAVDDSKSTNEDTALVFPKSDLTANDTDVDGDTLTVTSVSSTASTHGTVVIVTDPLDPEVGKIRYTPAANYNGPASFDYAISDGNGGTDTGTVTITVDQVNDAPVATDGTASLDEDEPRRSRSTCAPWSVTSRPPMGNLVYTIVAGPTAAQGTLTPVSGEGTAASASTRL